MAQKSKSSGLSGRGTLFIIIIVGYAVVSFVFNDGLYAKLLEWQGEQSQSASSQLELREYSDDGYIWVQDDDGIWGCYDRNHKHLFDIGEGEVPLDFRKGTAFVQCNNAEVDVYGGDYFVKPDGSKTMLTKILPPKDVVLYSLYDVGSELFVVKVVKAVSNASGVKAEHAYWGVLNISTLSWHKAATNPVNVASRYSDLGEGADIPINKENNNQNNEIIPLTNNFFIIGRTDNYNDNSDNRRFNGNLYLADSGLVEDNKYPIYFSYQQYTDYYSEGVCYIPRPYSSSNEGGFYVGGKFTDYGYYQSPERILDLKDYGEIVNHPKFIGGYAVIVFNPDADKNGQADANAATLIQIIDINGKSQLASPVELKGSWQNCEYGELSCTSIGNGQVVFNNAVYDVKGNLIIEMPKSVEYAAIGRFKYGVARVQNFKAANGSTKFLSGSYYIDANGDIVDFVKEK